MDRSWIVLGDPTSSGGSVVTGSPFTDIDGIPVARVTDQATCPRHKGAFPIVDGDSTMIVDGQPVALHGSSLACGCKVLSANQARVFVSQGPGAGTGATTLPMQYTPPAAGTQATDLHPLDYPGPGSDANTPSDPDWKVASDVITDSHQALMQAGAYRDYDTELEAARAWREHVLPVANSERYGVEVGAIIGRTPAGKYRFGAPWSSGEHASVRGIMEQAQRPAGIAADTAAIHTHPRAGALPGGGDRAFRFDQRPDANGVGGYGGSGDVQAGDLVFGYYEEINVYIADSSGLHYWDYEVYLDIQREDLVRPIPLRDAYQSGL
ncbi:PAAR domain-containing protein [Luteimonas qiangzhengi]|uniref:PAAR domain-containing protein n=1 Tax=Luteimonas sp. MJ146 TaxID=3129240 RepID=UPI0031BB60D8